MPPTAPVLRVDLTHGGGFTVARVAGCGSLTEENAPALDRELGALPGPWAGQWLLLDLVGIRSLGAAACSTLLRLSQAVRAGRGRLTLIRVRPGPYQVFMATGLDQILDVRPIGRRAGSIVGQPCRGRNPGAGRKSAGNPFEGVRQPTSDRTEPDLPTVDSPARSSAPTDVTAGGVVRPCPPPHAHRTCRP
jgi:anti-anti-sigma factor